MSSNAGHDLLRDEILLAVSQSRLAVVWPAEVGVFRLLDRPSQKIRIGILGLPDITGILINGLWLGIEVKTGSGVLRNSQENFKSIIEKYHGIYIVGRSVEQVMREISLALK